MKSAWSTTFKIIFYFNFSFFSVSIFVTDTEDNPCQDKSWCHISKTGETVVANQCHRTGNKLGLQDDATCTEKGGRVGLSLLPVSKTVCVSNCSAESGVTEGAQPGNRLG